MAYYERPGTIKAPAGKVLRAYMFDFNPFTRDIRRVLINEFGLVFVPGGGWSSLQDGNYKFKIFPEPVEEWDTFGMWAHWWEKKAWQNVAWAWCYMYKMPQFQACSISSDGFAFAV